MRKLVGTVLLALMSIGCPKGTQGLATASDTIAHALNDTQQAITIACQANQIDAPTCTTLQSDIVKIATAGKTVDASIRANENTTALAPKLDAFLGAFNQLNNQDLLGIKNPNTKVAISTILTGAESAVAVIAAAVGGK